MQVNPFAVRKNIAGLIRRQKRIPAGKALSASFNQLGFDALDLVDLILEVEKIYHVNIPDEVPLNKIDDFAAFICQENLQQAS